jgi:hypothetical protein
MDRLTAAARALVLGSILGFGGCVAVPVGGYTYGYAPYGPSYVTPDGVALAYDYGPGAYTVVGVPGLYWWGGYYYRRHGGYWQWSHSRGGPWAYRSANRVPFAAQGWGYGRRGGVRWH